jgi:plasmid stability protein
VPNAQKTLCIEVEQFLHNFGQLNSAIMIAMEAVLAQLLVRNLEDQLKVRLQRRAKSHGHSMEAEARDILRNALRKEEIPAGGLGTEIVAMFSGSGIYLDEPIAEIHDMRMEIPDFES